MTEYLDNIRKTTILNKKDVMISTENCNNLKNYPMNALFHIIRNIGQPEDLKSTIEFSFGTIKDIFLSDRINYRTSHAVIFNDLSQSHVFEEGIAQNFYNKTSYKFEEENSNKTIDTISIHNTIRKISEKGDMAVYKKKYKSVLCFVYFPNRKYDIRISLCREEVIQNPDRNNKLYIKSRNREKMYFLKNDMKFILKKSSDAEIVNSNTRKNNYYYGIKISMLYDEKIEISTVMDAILEFNTEC